MLQKGNVIPYSQGRSGGHKDFGGEYGAVPGSCEFKHQRMPGGQAMFIPEWVDIDRKPLIEMSGEADLMIGREIVLPRNRE